MIHNNRHPIHQEPFSLSHDMMYIRCLPSEVSIMTCFYTLAVTSWKKGDQAVDYCMWHSTLGAMRVHTCHGNLHQPCLCVQKKRSICHTINSSSLINVCPLSNGTAASSVEPSGNRLWCRMHSCNLSSLETRIRSWVSLSFETIKWLDLSKNLMAETEVEVKSFSH